MLCWNSASLSRARLLLWCVPPLCSVGASLPARCFNTTGPLAEMEAGGQRAAAQSLPGVLTSAAENILDTGHLLQTLFFPTQRWNYSCLHFSFRRGFIVWPMSLVKHIQTRCRVFAITSSHPICMCAFMVYAGFEYVCDVFAYVHEWVVCSVACRSSFMNHGSICFLVLMRNSSDSWPYRCSWTTF